MDSHSRNSVAHGANAATTDPKGFDSPQNQSAHSFGQEKDAKDDGLKYVLAASTSADFKPSLMRMVAASAESEAANTEHARENHVAPAVEAFSARSSTTFSASTLPHSNQSGFLQMGATLPSMNMQQALFVQPPFPVFNSQPMFYPTSIAAAPAAYLPVAPVPVQQSQQAPQDMLEQQESSRAAKPGNMSNLLLSLSSSLESLAEAAVRASSEESSEVLKRASVSQESEQSAEPSGESSVSKSNIGRDNSFSNVTLGEGGMVRGISAVMEMGGFGVSGPVSSSSTNGGNNSTNNGKNKSAVWGGVDSFPGGTSQNGSNASLNSMTKPSEGNALASFSQDPINNTSGNQSMTNDIHGNANNNGFVGMPLSMMHPSGLPSSSSIGNLVAAAPTHAQMMQPYYLVPTRAADGSIIHTAQPFPFQPQMYGMPQFITSAPPSMMGSASDLTQQQQQHQQQSDNEGKAAQTESSGLHSGQPPQQYIQHPPSFMQPYAFDPRIYAGAAASTVNPPPHMYPTAQQMPWMTPASAASQATNGYYFTMPPQMQIFQTMPVPGQPTPAATTAAVAGTAPSSTRRQNPGGRKAGGKNSPKRKRIPSQEGGEAESVESGEAPGAASGSGGIMVASMPIPVIDAGGRLVYMESNGEGGMVPWTGSSDAAEWGIHGGNGGNKEEVEDDDAEYNRKNAVPRRYLCSLCSKRFTRPSTLRTHMNSHTGERPFVCTAVGCGWKFTVLSNLKRHLKICPSVQQQMSEGGGTSGYGEH